MMKKVGVTGNMGSGKTTVCKIFASLHIPIFNADQEAKSLYRREDVKKLIRKAFGDHLFDAQGALMLTGFADLIFNDMVKIFLS